VLLDIYYCTNCKKKVETAADLLFIERRSLKGFCCDGCILEFYAPVIDSMREQELIWRHELNLKASEWPAGERLADQQFTEKCLHEPTELRKVVNELDEEFFIHILTTEIELQVYHYIIVTSHFEEGPSFIYFQTLTQSQELVNRFKMGSHLLTESENPSTSTSSIKEERLQLPSEMMECIDHKKSELLAKLLQVRLDSDIELEQYPFYEGFLQRTLDDADKIIKLKEDLTGDYLVTYIKSFQENNTTFFYTVVCLKIDVAEVKQGEVLVPVLSFPSVDSNLYEHFSKGEVINKDKIAH
jgi:hypothetical protein